MTRQYSAYLFATLILVAFSLNYASAADPHQMLMLTQNAGFMHRPVKRESEPLSGAEIAMTLSGRQSGEFIVDCSQDAATVITKENLQKYDIVAFYTKATALEPFQGQAVIKAAEKKLETLTWTDPKRAAAEDTDFNYQGEYGFDAENTPWGVQVVALGGGNFDAYLLEDGLPGLGWAKNKSRVRLSGTRINDAVRFNSEDSKLTAILQNQEIVVSEGGKLNARLPKLERRSPTLGAKPTADAKVLFDGSSVEAWIDGVMEDGLLWNTNVKTKELFNDYKLHLEFRTPYKPYARGQQRGNSGVYHQGRFETQVLDSFGLEGLMNETGGIYTIAAPSVNMCFPPLTWQTYDVEFTSARFDSAGTLTSPAKITVMLNGVVVHKDQELPKTTAAAPVKKITPEPGPLFLQHHNNPIRYRNIWIVPRKS